MNNSGSDINKDFFIKYAKIVGYRKITYTASKEHVHKRLCQSIMYRSKRIVLDVPNDNAIDFIQEVTNEVEKLDGKWRLVKEDVGQYVDCSADDLSRTKFIIADFLWLNEITYD